MADQTCISDNRARSFADALKKFETGADVASFAQLFTTDATTQRFDARGERRGEVEQFWQEYHDQFTQVSTTFSNVVEGDDTFALEWSSEATLAAGRPITYREVTVVAFEGDKIVTLRTYYDSAQFTIRPADS